MLSRKTWNFQEMVTRVMYLESPHQMLLSVKLYVSSYSFSFPVYLSCSACLVLSYPFKRIICSRYIGYVYVNVFAFAIYVY
jgi:hypothetical protein